METLLDLYGTHDGKVSDKWTSSLQFYEHTFAALRNDPVRILEIGVQNGGSLEIWGKYFPSAAHIVGCDIDERCRNLTFEDRRIALVVGDANAPDAKADIRNRCAEFDIIIDDGSHRSGDIIRSFATYFPMLADGGIFIAEDLHCSYWQQYDGGLEDPASSMSFFRRLTDLVNCEHWGQQIVAAQALSFFAETYDTSFDHVPLDSIWKIAFQNSLCAIWKNRPETVLLGPRVIAGRIATVTTAVVGLSGTSSASPAQGKNPFGPSSRRREAAQGLLSAREVGAGKRPDRATLFDNLPDMPSNPGHPNVSTIKTTGNGTPIHDFPPEFCAATYRSLHADLAEMDDQTLRSHYERHGKAEGRQPGAVRDRSDFLRLFDKRRPALEIGPFDRCLLDPAGVRYFDILDQGALQTRARALGRNAAVVPVIDFVSPTGDLACVTGPFELILSSHVIENVPDLIAHLKGIGDLLSPTGVCALIVSDCRYCFDHFLPPSSIADVLQAAAERRTAHSLASVVEQRSLTTHNDPARHWAKDHGSQTGLTAAGIRKAIAEWRAADGGFVDVHAWQFTPDSFRHLLTVLAELGHIGLRPLRVYQPVRGSNEFLAILVPASAAD